MTTRSAYSRAACEYLLYFEANGITSLQEADGASVFEFLESLSARWAKTAMWSAVSSFRPFLNFTQRYDLLNALKMTGVKRHHGIVPLLSNEEEETVVQACMNGQVSARDVAITLLALMTGLRACDLVSLRLKDIDWRSMTVGIVQQKTSTRWQFRCPLRSQKNLRSMSSPRGRIPKTNTCFCVRSRLIQGWRATLPFIE